MALEAFGQVYGSGTLRKAAMSAQDTTSATSAASSSRTWRSSPRGAA
jgi:hypothetical protein